MNNNFQPIKLLQSAVNEGKTGHLKVTANQVVWDLYFVEGMLQDATHSLQSLNTIQHYLLRHDQKVIAKVIPTLAKTVPSKDPLIPGIFKELSKQKCLTNDEIFILTTDLIKDALESYLWLREGEYSWSDHTTQSPENTAIKGDNLLAISPLLDALLMRIKAWKLLSYAITSPYQRLVCLDHSLIGKKVPSGNLKPKVLERLVKVMQGKTLRQISLFLKQDELKVAQLLLPYFQNNILDLKPPQPPLDRLPLISSLTPIPETKPQKLNSSPSVKKNDYPYPQTKKQKAFKVVCIDDSPTILDMIKAYLSSDQFQVFTVDNPTQSLPCLFECKPDLILIDFSMPGINGNKLCRIIKGSSLFKNTPIIMISGNEKMLTPENIKAAGATDFLAKPFTKEVLVNMLSKHLYPDAKNNKSSTKNVKTQDVSSINFSSSKTSPKNIKPKQQPQESIANLFNQQSFKNDLSVALQESKDHQSSFTLIFLKLDKFEAIYGTLGETIAEKIIKQITQRIQGCIRGSDVLARYNRSEFVLLLKKMGNPNIIEKISQRIVDTVKKTPLIFEHELALEVNQTIKICPQDRQDIEAFLKDSRLSLTVPSK